MSDSRQSSRPIRRSSTRTFSAGNCGNPGTAEHHTRSGRPIDKKPPRSVLRYRALSFAAVVALALASGGLAAACSSTTSSSSGTTSTTGGTTSTTNAALAACVTANGQFDKYVSAQKAQSSAEIDTATAWLDYDNKAFPANWTTLPSASSPELNAAIAQFNANNQKRTALKQTSAQNLATYQSMIMNCDQSRLPAACQADFAAHQPLVDVATRLNTTADTFINSITARTQAIKAGDKNAVNAQADPFNTAKNDYLTANNEWDSAETAHSTTAQQCANELKNESTTAPQTGGSKVTAGNYRAITKGMTLDQVEKILGSYDLKYEVPEYHETGYTWEGPNGSSIDVFFDSNGHVIDKSQEGNLG